MAVQADQMTATEHFLLYGHKEGRIISPMIDLESYMAANPDVASAVKVGMSPLVHMLVFGLAEGRNLGNGISASSFHDDLFFQTALSMGDYLGALDRAEALAQVSLPPDVLEPDGPPIDEIDPSDPVTPSEPELPWEPGFPTVPDIPTQPEQNFDSVTINISAQGWVEDWNAITFRVQHTSEVDLGTISIDNCA